MCSQIRPNGRATSILAACVISMVASNLAAETIKIDAGVKHQLVRGFGGMNLTEPGEQWKVDDLTTAQAERAFGNGDDQLGLSILRVRVPYNPNQFQREVRTAKIAHDNGAIVFASPWSPPTYMKTNNNLIGGRVRTDQYGAYADHLLSFAELMENNGAPLYAISVQNEPDFPASYESTEWSAQEMINFLIQQGAKFGDLQVIAPESLQMRRSTSDPLLNNAAAAAQFDIVGGHIYGGGLGPYPLAQQKGKELWMTEHYTTSDRSANDWPDALGVGDEVHQVMSAGFNAYVWWYIRRFYGLMTDDGNISKRGYVFSHFSKFVRPGYTRIGADGDGLWTTAYQKDDSIVVVVVNNTSSGRDVSLNVSGAQVDGFTQFTTSGQKNVVEEGLLAAANNIVQARLDSRSITTFVSYGESVASSSSSSSVASSASSANNSSSVQSVQSSSATASSSSGNGSSGGAIGSLMLLLFALSGLRLVSRKTGRDAQ